MGDLRDSADIPWNIGDAGEVVAAADGQPRGKSRAERRALNRIDRVPPRILTLFLAISIPKSSLDILYL